MSMTFKKMIQKEGLIHWFNIAQTESKQERFAQLADTLKILKVKINKILEYA